MSVTERLDPRARWVLDFIDSELARGGEVATELWQVLSALRGPDGYTAKDDVVKTLTTARIRSAAFPKTAKNVEKDWLGGTYSHGAEYAEARALTREERGKLTSLENDHFGDHTFYALRLLGLID